MATGYKGLRMSGNLKQLNMGNMKVQKGIDFIELAERGLITEPHTITSTVGTGHKKTATGDPIGAAASSTSVDLGNILNNSSLAYDYGEVADTTDTASTRVWAVRRAVASSLAAANAAPVYPNYDWTTPTRTDVYSYKNISGRFKIPSVDGGGAVFSPTATNAGWNFGRAVAQSDDYYVVAAPGLWYNSKQNLGAVFVYRKSDNALLHTIQPPVADQYQGMGFGTRLEIHDNKILIQTNEYAYLYDAVTGNTIHKFTPTLLGGGGQSSWGLTNINMTENYSMISAAQSYRFGTPNKAWVFDNNTGALVHIVEEQTADSAGPYPYGAMYGIDCAMNDNYFAVGSSGGDYADQATSENGYVEIYNMSSGTIARRLQVPAGTAAINDFFGKRIDIDGNRIAVSCPGKDTIYIFDITTGTLLNTVTGLTFHASVAANYKVSDISLSGNAVAIATSPHSGNTINVEVVDISTSVKLLSFNSLPSGSQVAMNYPSQFFGSSINLRGGELIIGSSGYPSNYEENKGAIYRYIAPVIAD